MGDVSPIIKTLIDRLAHICHRPEFYNKCAMILTTTSKVGIRHAINTIGAAVFSWGFHNVAAKGFKISDELRYDLKRIHGKKISKLAKKFYLSIKNKEYLKPSLLALIVFKLQQKYHTNPLITENYDYIYWNAKGWTDPKMMFFMKPTVNRLKLLISKILSKIICWII